jgi:hypothetical protein
VGQDALLDRGGPVPAADDALGGQAVVVEQAQELVAAGVVAHHGAEQRRGAQGLHVQRHVGRPAQALLVAGHVDHRHGRFGRKPRGLAPHVSIHHHVADNEDAQVVKSGEKVR